MTTDAAVDKLALIRLEQEVEQMARDLLQKAGSYPPFGAVLDSNGKVELLFDQTAVAGGATARASTSMLRMIRQEAKPAHICAAAIANMGYTHDDAIGRTTMAIILSLHHRAGQCLDVVIPFTKAASGKLRFGEGIVRLGQTTFF
jgi:hypothetical protein